MIRSGKKIVPLLLVVVVSLVLVAIGSAYYLLTRCLPVLDGTVQVRGLTRPVEVYRDDFGVPHIVAESEHDLMLAAGYVQAQDRLWQMDFLRRVAAGRLSEILGSKTLEADRVLRLLGLFEAARMNADSLDPVSAALLQAYAEGVNAYIDENRHNYPIEFVLLDYTPEPWKPEHTLSIAQLMAFQLCMGWMMDVTYGRIIDTVGLQKAREIFPEYPDDAPVIVGSPSVRAAAGDSTWSVAAPSSLSCREAHLLETFVRGTAQVRKLLGFGDGAGASNNWAVAGSRSVSGKPLLANDPHLGLAAPSIWYEMHLKGGRLDVTGFAMAGVPLIVLGNNRRVAWGFTNVMTDDADFYRERLNDKGEYYFNGQWRPLGVRREMIEIRDSAYVILHVQSTHRGPIVSEAYDSIRASSDAISFQWLAHRKNESVRAILGMNLASNWTEFREATRFFQAPGQNVVYADVDGHIAYQCMSGIPIRRNGNGIGLQDGTTDQYDWRGTVPFDELPYALDPPTGFLASANNKVAGDGSHRYVGNYWEHPSRAKRIVEFLSRREVFSTDDFKQLQGDEYSHHAAEVLPYVLAACENDSLFRKPEAGSSVPYETYLFLKHWDRRMDRGSRGAAIFSVFFQKLIRHTYGDEMGENLYEAFLRFGAIPFRVTTRLLDNRTSSWWDDQRTDVREDREGIIRRSLVEAMADLTGRISPEPAAWTWEKLHTVTIEHPIGKQKPMDHLFNVGPVPVGGSSNTVNKTQYNLSDSTFKTVWGVSMRRIVDLADPLHPQTILSLGQSGQVFSPHYSDQFDRWLRGQYKTVSMEPAEYTRAKHLLTLSPEPRP